MSPSGLLRLAFVLVALARLTAADTLTVGPAGSGAQFTEIQAAIDAAHDDDVILVRPGSYQPIVVDKPLRVLGDGSASVTFSSSSGPLVKVHGIAAGEEFVLSGMSISGHGDEPLVLLRDCPGTVVLQDLVVLLNGGFAALTGPLQVSSCSRAVLLDSRFSCVGQFYWAPSAVNAADSTLWIGNSELTANQDAVEEFNGSGLSVSRCRVHVWRTSILGGVGKNCFNQEFCVAPGYPGITAVSSRIHLLGGLNSSIVGGAGNGDSVGHPSPGGSGLSLFSNSFARIQADLRIQPGSPGSNSSPRIKVDATSSFAFDPRIFPILGSSTHETSLGATFTLDTRGSAGAFQVLYLSLRTGPTTTYRGTAGFGLLVLDRTQLFPLAGETLPPSATTTINVRVPNDPALLGTTLFFQTAERSATGYAISNPVLVTITH